MSEPSELILEVKQVSKRFGGIQALEEVDFDLHYGEVHALVGENGAGKSTLMNILGGILQKDAGQVIYKGQEVNYHTPIESIAAGIAVIHQELAMLPALNVIENVWMGRMPSHYGRVRWRAAEAATRRVLEQVGLEIDPETLVSDLSISQRQLVEIAKALSMDASLIIMDEPNSSLSETETERLFEVIRRLKDRRVAVIYVSHKIEEVLRISDRISVLRDGQYRGTLTKAEATVEKVITMMVGRELRREAEDHDRSRGPLRLEVRGLCGKRFRDVSFEIFQGEIIGFAGLVGAGRSEVARAIFGADPYSAGDILLDRKPVRFTSPAQAIASGLAMVPEDRKLLSLFMDMPVLFNISMAELPRLSRMGIIDHGRVATTASGFVRQLSIKLASVEHPVRSLSGGNQQKTTLARWLATRPKLLIMDEPTHGVDIGAKAEIYQLMRNLAREGISILLISSELPEIMAMSDRVVVFHEGRVTGILDREQLSENTIMMYATGMANGGQGLGISE
jgi:ribose transport system ATP-binding protein